MNILVTGNLGYIGPRLTARLGEDGHTVIGLDAGWFADALIESAHLPPEQHYGDLRELTSQPPQWFEEVLERVDVVCHLAAVSNDPVADLNPTLTREINVDASERLAQLARRRSVKRFIFFSSCSVYGDAEGEVDEATEPRVLTPYADSKIRLEQALTRMAHCDFWPVILRNATVFGYAPALRLDLLVNGMTAWALTTGMVRLISTGEAFRPQVHVDDVADLTAALIRRSDAEFERAAGEPINVGHDANNYSIRELAEIVAARVEGAQVVRDPDAWVDRRSYQVSFERARLRFPDVPLCRTVADSITDLAAQYARVGLRADAVRDLRYTRLGQLRAMREHGILDGDLRWQPARASTVAP